jgi:hypothetical protein
MEQVWNKIEDEVYILFRYKGVDFTLSGLSIRVTYSIEQEVAKYYSRKQKKKVK